MCCVPFFACENVNHRLESEEGVRSREGFRELRDGDLQLAKGVVVLLMRKTHAHWWEGAVETEPVKEITRRFGFKLQDGQTGMCKMLLFAQHRNQILSGSCLSAR